MSGRPIGFIADDITGATDLASALAGRGISTRLVFGTNTGPLDGESRLEDVDAVVVALKIRSVPASEARSVALAAAEALTAVGAEQLFSKYCSTFDSTDEGNIGPIADAMIEFTGARRFVHAPSYPANRRTVYLGHLFVGTALLSESPMRDHPLNPMRDSLLPRVLAAQTRRPVLSLPLPAIDSGGSIGAGAGAGAGANAVESALAGFDSGGSEGYHVIADAIRDRDLDVIARAISSDPLAGGSAAFGAAFAAASRERAGRTGSAVVQRAQLPAGPTAILAGSLSTATREQVKAFSGPTLLLTVGELVDGDVAVRRALDFAERGLATGPVLIATEPAAAAVPGLDPAEASRRVELAMGRIGVGLEKLGVSRLIVAGGETSGAVADALVLRSAGIGPDISVGVPWIVAEDRNLALAFKSGNFGGPTFFSDALVGAGQ